MWRAILKAMKGRNRKDYALSGLGFVSSDKFVGRCPMLLMSGLSALFISDNHLKLNLTTKAKKEYHFVSFAVKCAV
jgi:hypothetical protein